MPAALAMISATAILAATFMPWVVLSGPYGTGSENGGMLFVLLSMLPLISAVLVLRGTPAVVQGCATVAFAVLLVVALWSVTLVGLVGLVATHKKDTATVGLGFELANIGCLTLAIAGVVRVILAVLIRRTAA